MSKEKFTAYLGKENRRTNWLGIMAVWLSGISMLVYFFSSYAVRNYFVFLTKNFNKMLEALFR